MAGTFRRPVPEMMMWVDDRQFGVEDRFGHLLGKPGLVRPLNAAPPLGRRPRFRHRSPPLLFESQDTSFSRPPMPVALTGVTEKLVVWRGLIVPFSASEV